MRKKAQKQQYRSLAGSVGNEAFPKIICSSDTRHNAILRPHNAPGQLSVAYRFKAVLIVGRTISNSLPEKFNATGHKYRHSLIKHKLQFDLALLVLK